MTLSLPTAARIVCDGRARASARPCWVHTRPITVSAPSCVSVMSCGAGGCVRVGRRRSIHCRRSPGRAPTAHARAGATRDSARPTSAAEDADASEVTRSCGLHGKHRLLVVNQLSETEWSCFVLIA